MNTVKCISLHVDMKAFQILIRKYTVLLILISLFALLNLTFLGSEESPVGDSFSLWIGGGAGVNSETGRPFALEEQVSIGFSAGPLYVCASAAGATCTEPGDERLLDCFNARIGMPFSPVPWFEVKTEGVFAWRSYGMAGFEQRSALVFYGDVGTPNNQCGFAFRTMLGYSYLSTTVPSLNLTWTDFDPLLGMGVVWFSGNGFELSAVVKDYSSDEASMYLKTFFSFGSRYTSRFFQLDVDYILKYTDFFTETAYRDGYAVRLALAFPLRGVFR